MESVLLRLYPRAWRDRYAWEMELLLMQQRRSLRTLVDLLAGAVDARLNPQPAAAPAAACHEGVKTMSTVTWCNPTGATVRDQWRSAGWMAGGTLVLTLIGVALQLRIGPNSFSEGLLYSAFPASMMLSTQCTYLQRYSSAARRAIAIGGAVFVLLVMWAATALSHVI
jgi:hypothetical protein